VDVCGGWRRSWVRIIGDNSAARQRKDEASRIRLQEQEKHDLRFEDKQAVMPSVSGKRLKLSNATTRTSF